VFFVMECTQDFENHGGSFEHIPNLICAHQMRSKCEAVEDMNVDCKHCGKCTHVFCAEDHVGKFIDYLRQSR